MNTVAREAASAGKAQPDLTLDGVMSHRVSIVDWYKNAESFERKDFRNRLLRLHPILKGIRERMEAAK